MATNCAGCCFQEGVPQTGCLVNQIGKYEYDIVNGSFSFKDKICQFWRGMDWALTQELKSPDVSLHEAVRAEVKINTCLVINGGSKEDVEKTLNSISGMNPSKIIAINTLDEVGDLLQKQGIPWTITTYLEEDDYRAWILMNNKNPMYCFVDGGFEFIPDFFGKIDRFVNDEMGRFLLIEKEGELLYISKNCYLIHNSPFADLIEKIRTEKEGYVPYEYFSS